MELMKAIKETAIMKGNRRMAASKGDSPSRIWKRSGIWTMALVVGVLTRKKLLHSSAVSKRSKGSIEMVSRLANCGTVESNWKYFRDETFPENEENGRHAGKGEQTDRRDGVPIPVNVCLLQGCDEQDRQREEETSSYEIELP
ncbi:MAG: hypothetical protein Q9157_003013 [Trypethelium eluteriae]